VIGSLAATAAIASPTTLMEAMAAPSVPVAPASPWAHAQKDAAVEISWPVKPIRRAGIRCIVVIAVRTNGLNTQINDDLRRSNWRQGQAGEQYCTSE
jgi:hypothetical protein